MRNALLRSLLFGCRHPSLRGEKKSVYVTAESVTRAEPLYNINQPPLINGPALALPLNGRTID